MKKIRYMDLFSGIGGFRQGLTLSKHPYECVLSCEIDKKARDTYSLLYNVEKDISMIERILSGDEKCVKEVFYNDVNKLADYSFEQINFLIPEEHKEEESIELLCGGFPCQPFSRSGKRQAFDDANKGNLFFSVMGVVKKVKPKQVLLENVKGLLTVGENKPAGDKELEGYTGRKIEVDKGRTFLDILDMLIEEKYNVEWQVLNSDKVIAHKRERVYIHGIEEKSEKNNIFPIVLDEKQNCEYKTESVKLKSLDKNDFINLKDKNLHIYEIVGELCSKGNLQIKNHLSNEIYEFGLKTPFQNWGRAFKIGNSKYIITKKLNDDMDSIKYFLEGCLENNIEVINEIAVEHNLNHLQVVKQIWSKSPKVVATGNKMGRMNFPDSVRKPSRTLTATGTLGREIMIVGYFIDDNKVKYIEPLDKREELLIFNTNDKENEEIQKLEEKFLKSAKINIEYKRKNAIEVNINYYNGSERKSKKLKYELNGEKNSIMSGSLYFRTLSSKEYWKLQGFYDDEQTLKESYKNLDSKINNFEALEKKIGGAHLRKQAGNAVTVKLIEELGNILN